MNAKRGLPNWGAFYVCLREEGRVICIERMLFKEKKGKNKEEFVVFFLLFFIIFDIL